jgi:hypothetical protein
MHPYKMKLSRGGSQVLMFLLLSMMLPTTHAEPTESSKSLSRQDVIAISVGLGIGLLQVIIMLAVAYWTDRRASRRAQRRYSDEGELTQDRFTRKSPQ